MTLAPQKGDLSADSTFCFAYKPFNTFCKEMFEGLIDLQPGTSISRGLKGTIPEHKMATVKGYFTMFNSRLVTPFWPQKNGCSFLLESDSNFYSGIITFK